MTTFFLQKGGGRACWQPGDGLPQGELYAMMGKAKIGKSYYAQAAKSLPLINEGDRVEFTPTGKRGRARNATCSCCMNIDFDSGETVKQAKDVLRVLSLLERIAEAADGA